MNISHINHSHARDELLMRHALELAQKAFAIGEVPVGALIFDNIGNNIVAESFNLRETQNSAIAHAEILAIELACKNLQRWRLFGCTLYVTLEPCFMCAGAIILARIPRVVFATADPKTGAVQSLAQTLTHPKLNHKCIVNQGIYAQESSELLKKFFKLKRI